MKHFSSPLIWLCVGTAILLNTYAAFDPNGVYADYRNDGAPAVAALFSALSDGVYPWSQQPEPVPDDKEVIAPQPTEIGDETPDSKQADAAAEQPDGAPVPDDAPQYMTVDASYFDDALFIGDSHTDGFRCYAGLNNATYYHMNGLTVWTALEKSFVEEENGKKLTLEQALTAHKFGKIYLMLGINELGDGTTESFAAQYNVVLQRIMELQPDAIVYVQAIFHSTQEKADSSFFKNEVINDRNAAIEALCDDRHSFFLDCNVVFDDETGVLRADYSGDGIHVKAPYYVEWKHFLFEHAIKQ